MVWGRKNTVDGYNMLISTLSNSIRGQALRINCPRGIGSWP